MEACKHLARRLQRLWQWHDATAATEYAVMLALIVLTALAAITALGVGVRDVFINEAWQLPSGAASG